MAFVVLATAVAGCGGNDSPDPTARHTANNGDVFSNADVTFATRVIQHHAQSLTLVDLLVTREVSPALTTVATGILERQGGEIEQAVDWLDDWDDPIPETLRDHANAHGDSDPTGDVGQALPGAVTADEIHDLDSLQGAEFEDRWLELMVRHHEGVAMITRAEVESGAFKDAVDLARVIANATESERVHLEALLG